MLTIEKFLGINNVLPSHKLATGELTVATNVNIGMAGEISRRAGFTLAAAGHHDDLHQAVGYMLATNEYGDLFKVGAPGQPLRQSLSGARVWYCDLPDGRTTFADGTHHGITDGTQAGTTEWGVPIPPSIGVLTAVDGALFPGDYQYALTYVRLSDGLEGGATYSNPVPIQSGGVLLTGLPWLEGHAINVYLSGHNAADSHLAGTTMTGAFSYLLSNSALTLPCRTEFLHPMPVGTVTAFWRGRVLVAQGNILWASMTQRPELCDMRRDFKQFDSPITLIQPVDDGVYVGTADELAFLSGTEFDKLAYRQVVSAGVVLGSGVAVRGELVKQGDGVGQGSAMICIADRVLVAGFAGGSVARMTEGRYATAVTEVAATFRQTNGIPQYVAVPQ